MLYDFTTITPDSVLSTTDEGIAQAEELVTSAIGGERTFSGTMAPLDEMSAVLNIASGRGAFMARVHPDAEVRDRATEQEERLSKWGTDLVFRNDLFAAVKEYSETDDAKDLEGEKARLVEFWMRDFRRAGHELTDSQRDELQSLKNRLVELEVAFARNIDDYRDHVELNRDQFDGLPDAYIDALEKGNGDTYKVLSLIHI